MASSDARVKPPVSLILPTDSSVPVAEVAAQIVSETGLAAVDIGALRRGVEA